MSNVQRLLLIFHLIAPYGKIECLTETFKEVLNSLKYPEKLIFDVTEAVNAASSCHNRTPANWDILDTDVQTSSILYWKRDYQQDDCYHNDTEIVKLDPLYKFLDGYADIHSMSIGFLVGEQLTENASFDVALPLTPSSIKVFLDKKKDGLDCLIFKLDNRITSFVGNRRPRLAKLKEMITAFKSQWTNIKIGLEYPYSRIYDDSVLPLLSMADLIIIDVDISPNNFLLSYHLFQRDFQRYTEPSQAFVRKGNPHCPILTKVNLTLSNSLKDAAVRMKYYYFLLQFSVFLINDGKGRNGIILGSFRKNSGLLNVFDGLELKQIVTPALSSLDHVLQNGVACDVKFMMKQAASNFENVVLEGSINLDRFTSKLVDRMGSSRNVCTVPIEGVSFPNFDVSHVGHPLESNFSSVIKSITGKLKGLPYNRVLYLVRGWSERMNSFHFHSKSSNIARGSDSDDDKLPLNITIVCNFGRLDVNVHGKRSSIQTMHDACLPIWNQTNLISWTIHLMDVADIRGFPKALMAVEEMRQLLLQQFPDKDIDIMLNVRIQRYIASEVSTSGLYCRPDFTQINAKEEAIINFARVHNLKLKAKPILNIHNAVGWWSLLKPVDKLKIRRTKYPVFVARNYPEQHMIGGNFQTDPCILWTEQLPKNGIKISENFSGASVFLNEMKHKDGQFVNTKELGIMMLFALHKFPLLELIPGSITDIESLVAVLSSRKFIQRLNSLEIQKPKLYLKLDCKFMENLRILTELKEFKLLPIGIHLENWETLVETDLLSFDYENRRNENVKLGLALEDCIDEANNLFRKLKSFKQFQFVDYIVCESMIPEELVRDRNKNEMEKWLDTHLYIQKYFHAMFPNQGKKEIIFHLRSTPPSPTTNGLELNGTVKIEKILQFFADVSQFAEAYKMKFFMFSAFDNYFGDRLGWWKILSHEDLANTSVYIEKESEYRKAETWRPSPKNPSVEMNVPGFGNILIGLLIIVSTLICSLILLFVKYKKSHTLLSHEEVKEYLKGSGQFGQEQTFANLKFPKEYEITKSSIILLNLLGKGNFGLVYNATLSIENGDTIPVAAKIPHPSSSKVHFKSFLSELKILCYVGNHPNVLRFVGAYVKEIGNGTVYIATELCKTGALQEYLRKLHQELLDYQGDSVSAKTSLIAYELIRFSHEIASGMEYIASKKIIHGDLSTRNVLLDSDLHCKIADFGLSRKLYEYQEYIKKSKEPIPWKWLAIESLQRMEFTVKSDVWSYGVTLWEIFSLGCVPYSGLSWSVDFVNKLENGLRLLAPTHSSDAIYAKMFSCWKKAPEQRPTFTELAEFFANTRNMDYTPISMSNDVV